MFRQLKEMFQKEEVPPLILASDEIPGWLKSEFSRVGNIEKDQVELQRKNILGHIENLKELVLSLGSAEHDGAVHPKLENVVEKSLPLYKKAILSALNRQYPENPDEFYIAATECLKGCLKSSAGPGRYLIGVFPGEMKDIRAAIDQVGREINSMNPVIADSRNKYEAIRKIGHLHESYIQKCEELRHGEELYPRLFDRSEALRDEIKTISEEIKMLSLDTRMKQLDDLNAEEDQLKEEHARALGEFISSGNMIVHVLKRAEKVAQKDHNITLAKKIRALAEHLSKSEIPAMPVLCQEMNEVLPDIIVMVEHEDIAFRNKEEHDNFSDPLLLPRKIQEIYQKIERTDHQLIETRRKIAGNSFIHEKESMDRTYRIKTSELEDAERSRTTLDGRITTLKSDIPSLLQQIENQIASYSGKKTIIRP